MKLQSKRGWNRIQSEKIEKNLRTIRKYQHYKTPYCRRYVQKLLQTECCSNGSRGSIRQKWSKLSIFFFYCSESVFGYGVITSQSFRGLSALEPPPQKKKKKKKKKLGAKGGPEGSKFVFFFNVFFLLLFIHLFI